MKRARRQAAGFTLVEMLLALALVGLILTEAYGIYVGAMKTHRSVSTAAELDNQAHSAMKLMAEDIERLTVQMAGGQAGVVGIPRVGGQAAPLLRLRTIARVGSDAGPTLVDYFLIPDDGLNRPLVRRAVPTRELDSGNLLTAEGSHALPPPEIILRNVQQITLRYFDGSAWTDIWNSATTGRLPRLIELTVSLESKDGTTRRYTRQFETIPGRGFRAEDAGLAGGPR